MAARELQPALAVGRVALESGAGLGQRLGVAAETRQAAADPPADEVVVRKLAAIALPGGQRRGVVVQRVLVLGEVTVREEEIWVALDRGAERGRARVRRLVASDQPVASDPVEREVAALLVDL